MKDIKWGGSGIEYVVFEYIKEKLPKDPVIIELGGGDCSTRAFSSIAKLYTIEHNNNFLKHTGLTNYIYAPIVNGWYDVEKVVPNLPSDYDMIFLDGPSGHNMWLRDGILKNLHIFKKNTPFVIHDVWREEDKKLAIDIAKCLEKEVEFYNYGNPSDHWAFVGNEQK